MGSVENHCQLEGVASVDPGRYARRVIFSEPWMRAETTIYIHAINKWTGNYSSLSGNTEYVVLDRTVDPSLLWDDLESGLPCLQLF